MSKRPVEGKTSPQSNLCLSKAASLRPPLLLRVCRCPTRLWVCANETVWNRAPQIGTWTHVPGLKPSLNPEWDMRPGLEPGQNPDWDLNPCSRTHPAKTHSLPTEVTYLVSGLNEAQVLDVSLQNSVRDKVIGNKWIYLERNTPQSRVWAISEGEKSTRVWGCQFL